MSEPDKLKIIVSHFTQISLPLRATSIALFAEDEKGKYPS